MKRPPAGSRKRIIIVGFLRMTFIGKPIGTTSNRRNDRDRRWNSRRLFPSMATVPYPDPGVYGPRLSQAQRFADRRQFLTMTRHVDTLRLGQPRSDKSVRPPKQFLADSGVSLTCLFEYLFMYVRHHERNVQTTFPFSGRPG